MKTEQSIDWGKTAAEIQADYEAVCQQRDELLAALDTALEAGCDGDWQCARQAIRAAIASVKGEAS